MTQTTAPPTFALGPLAAKLALCLAYLLFLYSHLSSLLSGGFRLSLFLACVFETVIVALVVTRRNSREVDLSPLAVAAGLLATFMVLAFRPAADGQELLIGQALQVVGAVLLLGAAASLGRSFGLMPANRGIRTGGLYRLVRHPFYFSYLFTQGGYVINNPSLSNGVVLVAGISCQVIRIRFEERLLHRDPDYATYAATVPWRLVPGLW